jgi:glycosyltransferase involved in cell wall biosynthesis
MKKTIIHDWLDQYAGSERCVESFTNLYPDADIFTLVDFLNDKDREIILNGKESNRSFIQKMPFAKRHHRNYLPLFPLAIEQFDLTDYDLVLSSSHAFAKGVLTHSNQLHISYVHTPIRYAWDLYQQYLKESGLERGLKGMVAKYFLHKIRNWDVATANRVDHYIANSHYIAQRIKKIYGKDATVIYPPVDVDKFVLHEQKEDFYLTASRMVPYKKIDLIVEAFSQTNKKLIVIGTGPEMAKIKNKAGGNIELLGYQSDEVLIEMMQKAKAFVFAAEEDFGIIPVEAQACGTPVISLNKGGTKETVIDKVTGVHFNGQNIVELLNALNKFENLEFNPITIREHALNFSRKRFERELKEFIDKKYEIFKQQQ